MDAKQELSRDKQARICDFFMMEIPAESKVVIFRFDGFAVDPSGFRVSKDGIPVELEPKALNLLIYLVKNPGRLLKKQDLLDAVWEDSSVTENALTRAIAILRRILNDTTKAPKYIETVPTQGYRFIAEVSRTTPEDTGPPELSADAADESVVAAPPSNRWLRDGMIAAGILLLLVVAALVYRELRKRHSGESADGELKKFRLVQVTFSGGLDGFPSFSPDGNSIVFSSDRSGRFDLYVRQLAENGGEVQLTRDSGGNIQPAWSPDGQWVAYHSLKNGGIWVIPALGGTPRRVTDFGSQPSWSHKGTQIAFQSGDLGGIAQMVSTAMPGATIWIVDVSGNGLRQVTKLGSTSVPGANYGDASPRWLPDDRRIMYENSGELWTIGVDGNEPRSVAADRFAYDPALSSDGHVLYFLSQDSEGSGLWRVELDPEFRAAGASVRMHNSAPASAQHLAYAGADRFAFSIMNTLDNLYSISISRAEKAAEPVALTQDTRLRKTRPLFSPNGSQISFLVAQRGRMGQVWVVGPDGKDPKQIPVGARAFDPDWCGENALCYWSYNSGLAPMLSRWDMARGRASQILQTSERMSNIRLSPDAATAAYQKVDGGAMNVWLLSLATGKSQRLTGNPGVTVWPAWSPDGRSVAVEIRDGANTQIAIVPSSGGTPAYLTHDAGQSWPYSWSPDGKEIAFAGSRGGIWNLYSVTKDSGAIRQFTHYTTPASFVRYPAWSPKGSQIVYEYGTSTANIWLLEPRK